MQSQSIIYAADKSLTVIGSLMEPKRLISFSVLESHILKNQYVLL